MEILKYKDRQSNIELLRILAMLGVIVLHYNNTTIGGGLSFVDYNSINYWILTFFESVTVAAVNIFVLITGYFSITSQKRNLWKPIELLLQVIIFNICFYVVSVLLGDYEFSIVSLFGKFIPANWFVILYITLYLISPLLNRAFNSMEQKPYAIWLIILFVLFSVWPTAVDLLIEITGNTYNGLSTIGMYGSQYGYTIVNFALMYIIGGYLRKFPVKSIKTIWLILILLANIIILTGWAHLDNYIGYNTERVSWEYCNPLVIVNAVLYFIIFSRINIGNIKIINLFSGASFTVYLVHNKLFRFCNIETAVTYNPFLLILHLIGCCILIYLVCFVIHIIYDTVIRLTIGRLKKKLPLEWQL